MVTASVITMEPTAVLALLMKMGTVSAIIAPLRNVLTLLTITVMASATTMEPTAVLALLMKTGMVSVIIALLPIQQLSRTVWADAVAITT